MATRHCAAAQRGRQRGSVVHPTVVPENVNDGSEELGRCEEQCGRQIAGARWRTQILHLELDTGFNIFGFKA